MTSSAAHLIRPQHSDMVARPASYSAADTEPMFDLMELFFFAYRDFVGDADRLLESYNFGRAHHRIIHFVMRQPGLTIAELLDILRITKQSLGRVLKDLLDKGYVESRAGVNDRRQRHLFPTPEGRRLALELARLQSQRFDRALRDLPPDARAHALAFLTAVIDPDDRDHVSALVGMRDSVRPKRAVP
jgi:DNA-binding MarR family transcriptional regulator